jgi:hypothetical protein
LIFCYTLFTHTHHKLEVFIIFHYLKRNYNLQNIFLQLQTKLYINKLNNHKSNTNDQMQLQIKIINNFSIFSSCAELLESARLSSETILMANGFRVHNIKNEKQQHEHQK